MGPLEFFDRWLYRRDGGATLTDIRHLWGHSEVESAELACTAFVNNEQFKQKIDLPDEPK